MIKDARDKQRTAFAVVGTQFGDSRVAVECYYCIATKAKVLVYL